MEQLDAALGAFDMAALRRIMRSTGHDLMQPLQIVSHALDRLGGGQFAERDRMWLDAARIQVGRIAGGLSELVEASLPRESASRGCFSLCALFDEIEADWSSAAQVAGVRLRVVRSSALVHSERRRVRSILDNLIGNAIKYSRSGNVLLGCRHRDGGLVIEVVDDGPGIAPDQQQRIFRAFCQIDPEREGLGLGLSLVREHCAALGHRVELASVPERGSRFSLLLAD
jgi:signal transduction histidine kinase